MVWFIVNVVVSGYNIFIRFTFRLLYPWKKCPLLLVQL